MFLAALIAALSVMVPMSPVPTAAQEATPAMTYACVVGTSTPGAMAREMPMAGTPAAGMDHMVMEFDQMYIDMMIPHHQASSPWPRPRCPGSRMTGYSRSLKP